MYRLSRLTKGGQFELDSKLPVTQYMRTVVLHHGRKKCVPLRLIQRSVAGVGIGTVIGTTGARLTVNKKIYNTVFHTTKISHVTTTYSQFTPVRANRTIVAPKFGLPSHCIVRATNPV